MGSLFFIDPPSSRDRATTESPARNKAQSFVMGLASLTLLQAISYSAVLRAIEAMEFNAIGFHSSQRDFSPASLH